MPLYELQRGVSLKNVHPNTVVLLGAGSSVDAGIPASYDMTAAMRAQLARVSDSSVVGNFDLIVSGILMAGSATKEQPRVDIERVLNATDLLANRSRTELAPFVAAWHPFVEAAERGVPSRKSEEELSNSITNMITEGLRGRGISKSRQSELTHSIDRLLTGLVFSPRGAAFQSLLSNMYAALVHLVWLADREETRSKIEYLFPLIEAGRRGRITIATLNYDNAIERCAAHHKVPFTTGIDSWIASRHIQSLSAGITLLKLHGSIDWLWPSPWIGADKQSEVTVIESANDAKMEQIRNSAGAYRYSAEQVGKSLAIIFGGDNKLSARGPFLDLLWHFKNELREAKHLVAVGYSFRDTHVNHIVGDWLITNPEARMTVIDKGLPPKQWTHHHHLAYQHMPGHCRERVKIDYSGAQAGLKAYFSHDA